MIGNVYLSGNAIAHRYLKERNAWSPHQRDTRFLCSGPRAEINVGTGKLIVIHHESARFLVRERCRDLFLRKYW